MFTAYNTARGFGLELDGVKVLPKGVIHAGGHHGEEIPVYDEVGVQQVVWFEAEPDAFKILKTNVGDRKGHHCINVLLTDGNESGKRKFYRNRIGEKGEQRAYSSIFQLDRTHPFSVIPRIKTFAEIEMETSSIANEMKKLKLPPEEFDYLSVNVQGAELLVLQGMNEYLDSIRWIFCDVEIKQSRYVGAPLDHEIESWLKRKGFKRESLTFFYRPA